MDTALIIISGLALLAVGAEGVIRGAVGIARRFGLSDLLIGLTLVGFGTSAPELITSVDAALLGSPGIALGNVLGSNIGNVCLILALVVIVRPIAVNPAAVRRDGVLVVAVSSALAGFALAFGELSRWTGLIFLGGLVAYFVIIWRVESKGGAAAALHAEEAHTHDPAPRSVWLSVLLALGGLALLVWGADLLVHGAIAAARLAGVTETVIGLTVVALGTSLPELVATLAAALKGRSDVAFGNIVGSNLYNVLGILGATALIHPIAIPSDVGLSDWTAIIGSAVFLMIFALTGRRLARLEGTALLGAYGLYLSHLLMS